MKLSPILTTIAILYNTSISYSNEINKFQYCNIDDQNKPISYLVKEVKNKLRYEKRNERGNLEFKIKTELGKEVSVEIGDEVIAKFPHKHWLVGKDIAIYTDVNSNGPDHVDSLYFKGKRNVVSNAEDINVEYCEILADLSQKDIEKLAFFEK